MNALDVKCLELPNRNEHQKNTIIVCDHNKIITYLNIKITQHNARTCSVLDGARVIFALSHKFINVIVESNSFFSSSSAVFFCDVSRQDREILINRVDFMRFSASRAVFG